MEDKEIMEKEGAAIDREIYQAGLQAGKLEQAALDQLNFDKERAEFWSKIEEARQEGRKEVVESFVSKVKHHSDPELRRRAFEEVLFLLVELS